MINVGPPTRKVTWHPGRKVPFKYLFNIYSELKPNALWEKGGEGIGVSPNLS